MKLCAFCMLGAILILQQGCQTHRPRPTVSEFFQGAEGGVPGEFVRRVDVSPENHVTRIQVRHQTSTVSNANSPAPFLLWILHVGKNEVIERPFPVKPHEREKGQWDEYWFDVESEGLDFTKLTKWTIAIKIIGGDGWLPANIQANATTKTYGARNVASGSWPKEPGALWFSDEPGDHKNPPARAKWILGEGF